MYSYLRDIYSSPQGAIHNVVRWVHRSSFSIRPHRGPPRYSNNTSNNQQRGPLPANGRIPIPESNTLFVDPGWYGTIVVETEGTNEALADLQERCGPGAFPPRARGVNGHHVMQAQVENRKVFRILREKRFVLPFFSFVDADADFFFPLIVDLARFGFTLSA